MSAAEDSEQAAAARVAAAGAASKAEGLDAWQRIWVAAGMPCPR